MSGTPLQPNSPIASEVPLSYDEADVQGTLVSSGAPVTITLPIVDGSTSYLTQAEFETTVNAAWLIIMAIFVFCKKRHILSWHNLCDCTIVSRFLLLRLIHVDETWIGGVKLT